MICSEYGVRESQCVVRNRYACPRNAPIQGIIVSCLIERADDYYNYLRTQLPRRGQMVFTTRQRSVHYVVTNQGAIDQIVSPECVAYGRDPTTAITHDSLRSFNEGWLYVALEGQGDANAQARALGRLLCCLARTFNIPLSNILTLAAIDTRYPLVCETLPSEALSLMQRCLNGEEGEPIPSPEPSCCASLRNDIALLLDRINNLEDRIEQLEARSDPMPLINALQAQINALQSQLGALETQQNSIQNWVTTIATRLARLEACYSKLPECMEQRPCGDAHYVIGACKQYVPNVPQVVDFETRVYDPDNIVTTGPAWCAQIGDGGVARTYRVQGSVTIEPQRWCVGKYVQLILEPCNAPPIVVASYVVPSGGFAPPVVLTFDQIVPVPAGVNCCARVRIESNDVTNPFFRVCQGEIRLTRV